MTASAATTTARSRRSTASSEVMASMYNAALAEMDVGELPVGVGEIDFDGAGDLRPTAPHLGDRVLEPLGQLDARLMLVAGHRIADRLAAALDHARHFETGDAALDVDLEFDRRKDRIVDLAQGGGEHLPDGGTGLGVLPSENA